MADRPGDGLHVAILGLGEAGARLAVDLAVLGVSVTGWDPVPGPALDGLRLAAGPEDAVHGCHVVLSVNSAPAAVAAARACAGALADVELYADLNTTAPSVKVAVGEELAGTGVSFADVALLAPVPRRGVGTRALASGPGADLFARRFRSLGMPVEVLSGEPGEAAQRKLLRSVFMKGLAASVVESLEAADAAGCEDWLRDEIRETLESADAALLERLVDGSSRHAVRRVDEMAAACEVLRDLGVEPRVASAAAAQLVELAGSRDEVGAK